MASKNVICNALPLLKRKTMNGDFNQDFNADFSIGSTFMAFTPFPSSPAPNASAPATTYIDFVATTQSPFQFQLTLDNQLYTAIITSNLAGKRYYINLYDLSGNLIFCIPLIGSPNPATIETISWANGTVTAVCAAPHEFVVGATVNLTIGGVIPSGYDGAVQAFVVDPLTFQWPLASDPGVETVPGGAFSDISLTAGYFSSTLVFRTSSQQFEVSP